MRQVVFKLLFTAGIGLSLMAFQNCSNKALEFDDVLAENEQKFFSYPYSSAPDLYLSSGIYTSSSALPMTAITFVGAAVYVADPTQAVNYTVSIKSADGTTSLCADTTGSLSSGSTAITFTCTLSVPSNDVLVKLVASSNGKSAQIQNVY